MLGLNYLLGLLSVDMGIDLGTANTLVCVRGEGIVLNEPSVVAVRRGTNEVLMDGQAVGYTAKEMLGKCPSGIEAIRPLKNGVIADFDITEAMLAAGFGPIVAQQEPRIVARLNTYFGYGAIARLRLVQGPPLTSAVLATARDESPAGHDSIAESGGNPPCDSASDSDRLPALERLRRALAARGQGPAGRQKA